MPFEMQSKQAAGRAGVLHQLVCGSWQAADRAHSVGGGAAPVALGPG